MRSYRIVFVIFLFFFSVSASFGKDEEKCIKGDCVNGVGKKEMGNGIFYEGQFKNGKPWKTGKAWGSNEKMKMEWKLGKGGIYRGYEEHFGEWKFTGTMQKKIFKGEFIQFGNGDKCIYNGTFTPKFKIFGKGKMKCSTGESYQGSFKNDVKHGYGVYTFPDPDNPEQTVTYKGYFKNDKKNGNGKLYSQSGKLLYSGRWIEGYRFRAIPSVDYIKRTNADPRRWLGGTLSARLKLKELLTQVKYEWDFYDEKNESASFPLADGQQMVLVWGRTQSCCGVDAILIYDKNFSNLIDKRMQTKDALAQVMGVIIGVIKEKDSLDQKFVPVLKLVDIK